MEDNIKQCPVCGEKYSDVICPECGFEIRQMLVAPIHPLIQKIEEQRLEIATRNWNKISNSEQLLQTLESEKESLESRNSELEQENEQLKEKLNNKETENKSLQEQIETERQKNGQLTSKCESLQEEKERLQQLLDSTPQTPQVTTQFPIAYLVCYVGGTDSLNLNNIYPIFKGLTVFGKGGMEIPQGAISYRLPIGDPAVQRNHFSISTVEDSATHRLIMRAIRNEGEWDYQYIGNKPREAKLNNNDKIMIGQVTLIVIKL